MRKIGFGSGIRKIGFSSVVDPDAAIKALFAGGKQGVLYDPSDLSTLFKDAAGTQPVTADGDPIGLIKDKSGNNNHATQPVSAARPIYKTDGILHWLQFDGVDDSLSIPALALFKNALYGEHFLAVEVASATVTKRALDFSTGGNPASGRFSIYTSVSGDNCVRVGGRRLDSDDFRSIIAGTVNTQSVVSAQINWELGSARIRNNSGAWYSDPNFLSVGNVSNTASLSANIGYSGAGSQSAEFKFFGSLSRPLLADDVTIINIESYLANKAGVTL